MEEFHASEITRSQQQRLPLQSEYLLAVLDRSPNYLGHIELLVP